MISVIIPALNEEQSIRETLAAVLTEAPDAEVVVADGGSTDHTAEIAEGCGALVVRSPRGRGIQMNAGASVSKGDVLVFLHADTVLEAGWSADVLRLLQDPGIAAGAFRLRIDAAGTGYRLIEKWVGLRSRVFSLPYGDQGLFMRRETFQKLSGFREIPLMEDVDMVERLREHGRVVVLPRRAVTQARRWRSRGILRTSLMNHTIMLLYRLGADPRRLARIYYGKK